MKINKATLLSLFVILILIILAAPLSGCTGTPVIEQAVTCHSISQSGQPGLISDTFAPDVKTIYCSVKLSDAATKPKIKGEWMVINSDEAGLKDYLIGTETITADKPYVAFGFTRSETLLPRGDYAIKLYINDKFVQSVSFKVQGEAAGSAATFSEPVICTCIDEDTNKPLDKLDTLPNNAGMIFCTAKMQGAEFGTVIKANWIYVKGEMQGVTDKVFAGGSLKTEGLDYVAFAVSPKAGTRFPIGEYAVKLLVDDKEQLSVPFKVVDSADIPGPYLTEAVTFAMKGSENATIDMTNSFAASIEAINCHVKVNNAPADTEVKIQWILVKSAQDDTADLKINEDIQKVQGTSPVVASLIRKTDPFPRGKYQVKIFLNGEEKIDVPFRVQ
ncbi:MAG: hypothetical protein NT082_07455 [Chloroflexi bacterium]|nr:hypothetical protein [Chloroflexota bacterium]